ncbi:MAG: carbamate kinase [Acidocella sp. 21-58-7]|nr:MAG: carbamate kinase [Acidocella sp. 21-58-7]HQT64043.1 carbamate kinase [Acidocella sp.]
MRIVVALGGNALLKRGQPLTAQAQGIAIDEAALLLSAAAASGHQLIVTHGNGPQVGLLALQSAAGPAISALPLDALGAESEGWIGYGIEIALRNALPEDAVVVTLLTQTLVDPKDEAFAHPTKPIGPTYDEATAKRFAETNNWSVAPDGKFWRRIVASPKPIRIIELASIKRLADSGAIVICAGGGGIPVCKGPDQKLSGIEAVIDKDATSGLLAEQIGADMFVMLTDVSGVCIDYGTKRARVISRASPRALADMSASFGTGSMGPKVAAACHFVSTTGHCAAIGALGDLNEIIIGTRGTIVCPEGGEISFRDVP